MKKLIAFQILIALAVGAVIGHFFPDFGMALRPVGDGFIRLIKMIVVPIVFSTIVIGAAGSGSMKKMGSLGIKTIIWFEVITTLVLGLGLLLANVLKPGVGLDLSHLAKKDIHELSGYTDKVVDFKQMILDIIPTNIIDVMARNDLLAVIFFAILFGVAAAGIGKASEPVMKFFESTAQIMFKLTQIVMVTAPIGVLALMAASVGQYGIELLLPMFKLVGTVFLGLFLILFVLFPLVGLIFQIKYFEVLKMIWDLFLIAFSTTSTETILPQLMDRMEKYGCPKRVVSFVVPSGLSLNCDGSSLYLSVSCIFLAQAFQVDMTLSQQLLMMLVLVMTSKGIAAVPSGSLVVLLATANAVGLPAEGVAIIAGVDRVMDMARTGVNVPGHAIACIVVSKWEKAFRQKEWVSANSQTESI
ncbi:MULTISPECIES: glutamate-aspartate/proton symporter GltP [Bacillaceae]|uniref:Proton/glutamate-aspartate symporter n=3 Tax=Bacillus subtilis subsp. subtilis TaxID=135461 RepID=GLTP_BACSU|nr:MULTISPECIES: glutamate-aspartate/proton symporter GltP [Bacillales]NP_388116.1 proton/glutamate symport protein [Bacillus subtilis subsp. subtilis str. 168]P39817.1 RecName: Full=Proton/glutamate-aspartate symporter; AltName: Full=Proton/glutamate symport protein [Bacillus subtilis subsp. subtilis str. 168]MBU8845544.1 glutamate-aspartate/proton symporter GltP [Alkalicoccobacillus gibsonii]MDP4112742.1 glutamate-aspartate/proton symporter GltP [Bacillota bacterium]BAM49164.1 proton/glutama